MPTDRWRELCKLVAQDDGLPVWKEAHQGTKEKLFFWYRYLTITTNAMWHNRHFPGGLVYVDLFAGSGVCATKDSKHRFPGSTLIAANMPKPFARIVACEQNQLLARACEARLNKTKVAARCRVLHGDCNRLVDEIVRDIPRRALTLAFIDPTGLDPKFATIAKLSEGRAVDFVTLFADAYDIIRNAEYHYRNDPNSKLDEVLGPDSRWREKLDKLRNPTGINRRNLFAEIYKSQLQRHLGYRHFNHHTICRKGTPLYRLIYASRHQLGLHFWKEALKRDVSGQRELF